MRRFSWVVEMPTPTLRGASVFMPVVFRCFSHVVLPYAPVHLAIFIYLRLPHAAPMRYGLRCCDGRRVPCAPSTLTPGSPPPISSMTRVTIVLLLLAVTVVSLAGMQNAVGGVGLNAGMDLIRLVREFGLHLQCVLSAMWAGLCAWTPAPIYIYRRY